MSRTLVRTAGLALIALAGAAVAIVPTLASGQGAPSTASFAAMDTTGVYGASHYWQSNTGGSQATIAQGGTVTFSYSTGTAPQGSTTHNVDFSPAQFNNPATPTCTQTAGSNSGSVPPLPHTPTGPDWSGSCTFTTPGTYQFWCDLHMSSMEGTVVVQGSGTTGTTGTTTSGGGGTTGTTGSPGGTTPGGTTSGTTGTGSSGTPPPAGTALAGATVARTQKGNSVHGSANVTQAGSTLTVNLQVAAASLARSKAPVSVGRVVRHSVGPGRVTFSVPLSARARRALRKHGKLVVTVKVRVVGPAGTVGSVTRKVTLSR